VVAISEHGLVIQNILALRNHLSPLH